MRKIRVATRSSSLATIQAQIVIDALKKRSHDINFEIVEIKSKGDIDKKSPLWKLSDSGFFTAAIEKSLRENKADIAIHSFKDLPIESADDIMIGACLDRKFSQDCVIYERKINSINDLPKGGRIGTSSLRRKAQILRLRPDLNCIPIRGNVPTRLGHFENGIVDAVVLAAASLHRLGLSDKISFYLDPVEFVPAAAQGAIAVQAKKNDDILKLLSEIDDKNSRITCEAERLVLHKIGAGCRAPAGVFARILENDIIIYAFASDENGQRTINLQKQGPVKSYKELAQDLADELLEKGTAELLKNVEI